MRLQGFATEFYFFFQAGVLNLSACMGGTISLLFSCMLILNSVFDLVSLDLGFHFSCKFSVYGCNFQNIYFHEFAESKKKRVVQAPSQIDSPLSFPGHN